MKTIKVLVSVAIVALLSSCTRVGVGHVGLKVNQTGDKRGVNPAEYVTGWVFYNPISSDVVEFPTFMQHVEYDEFKINAHGGSQFDIKPYINYVVDPSKADTIYMSFKTTDLDVISTQYIRNAVYQAFTDVTGKYSPDDLLKNRESYEKEVFSSLARSLKMKGFILQQVTSNLTPPATLVAAIDAKNKADQDAQAIQLQVAQSVAQANKDIAKAKGDSAAAVINASGQAKAIKVLQAQLTPEYIEYVKWSAWDGKLPVYGQAPQMFKNMQ